jgi:hypothetical protein
MYVSRTLCQVRRIVESHHAAINSEKDRYEGLQGSMDSKIANLRDSIKSNEQDHIKTAAEIENRYEHKLADQFERYDRLSEEMEAINQKCQGLLQAERGESERLMADLRQDNRHREKKLKSDFKRVRDERATDENAFKEILDQQEDEYESELKQLIAAAEDELKKERETITKYQTFAQTQTTKLDQYNKRYKEVQEEYKKGLEELKLEKKEKVELLEAVEHYKKNLCERDIKLADKDKLILELRSNIRTLENFRVVLDHRQQQLNAEKGPITEHIVGLENHIRTMYEELVEEFETKKAGAMEAERKDLKLAASAHEVSRLRADNRQKEVYIAAFKRDLENILGSFGQKEIEDSIHRLYKKYIKGEDAGRSKDSQEGKTGGASKTSALATRLINNDGDSDDDDCSYGGGGSSGKAGGGGQRGSISKVGKKKRKKELISELNAEFLDNAKEANRQRAFIERSASDLKHRLDLASVEQVRSSQRRLHENSHLVFECNELRSELRNSARKLKIVLEEKDRLMVALANAISGDSNANLQNNAKSMLKTMQLAAVNEANANASLNDNASQTASHASAHSKVSIHSTHSIDSRRIPAMQDTAVEELVQKTEHALGEARPAMDDDHPDPAEERSLTSTGGHQAQEADKWWDGNNSKPTSPINSRKNSVNKGGGSKPGSAGGLANSYSTNALPAGGGSGKLVLSQSTPALNITRAVAKIPYGGRPSKGAGGLSSLMLPALPSEDLGSMSEVNQGGHPMNLSNTLPGNNAASTLAKNKLLARRTNPAQTLSQKAGQSHNTELKIKRASHEIDHLTRCLDDSEKEKLVQQAEIMRLRNQMQKMTISAQTANSPSPKKGNNNKNYSVNNYPSVASSVFVGSHRDDGLYPPEMQTAADLTGVPSHEDMDAMRVSSAKGSARGLKKPSSGQGQGQGAGQGQGQGVGQRPASSGAAEGSDIIPGLNAPVSSADVVKKLPAALEDDMHSMNSSLSAGSARR